MVRLIRSPSPAWGIPRLPGVIVGVQLWGAVTSGVLQRPTRQGETVPCLDPTLLGLAHPRHCFAQTLLCASEAIFTLVGPRRVLHDDRYARCRTCALPS